MRHASRVPVCWRAHSESTAPALYWTPREGAQDPASSPRDPGDKASLRRPSELAGAVDVRGSPKKERDFGLLPCAVGPCPSLPPLRKPRSPLLVIPQWSPDEGDGSHCTAMQMNECAVSR